MKSPLYKTGDVVKFNGLYGPSYSVRDRQPMIVLSSEYWTHDEMYVYELLVGDRKISIYERCLELVS